MNWQALLLFFSDVLVMACSPSRLHEKCTKILLMRSSYAYKAEELLWKRGFYDVVQRCKQQQEVINIYSLPL